MVFVSVCMCCMIYNMCMSMCVIYEMCLCVYSVCMCM